MHAPEITALDWQIDQCVEEADLAGWEAQTGYSLPDDYRQFLLRYNGGAVRPWIFRHDHPEVEDGDRECVLDFLHDWKGALRGSELGIAQGIGSQPPDHLLIGQDPGGGGVLLSLADDHHGRIVYWQRLHLVWGQEPNDAVGFIAPSFTRFLAGLFVDEADTEHGYWSTLRILRAARPLVL